MLKTWNLFLAVVFTFIAMFLVAAVSPVLAGQLEPVMTDDDATELIAADLSAAEDKKPGLDVAVAAEPERLSASPGAAYAVGKVTTCIKVTDNANNQPPGGAADRVTGVPDLSTA